MVDTTNIENSQELAPDAEIVLFHLTTTGGTNIYFKSGPQITYLGDTYESLPCGLSAEKRNVDGDPQRPVLNVGGDDIDFSILKPALFAGQLDGATVQKHVVELEDLKANNDVKITTQYRVKQVQSYTRFKISLILGRFSPASQTTIPYVQYTRPDFPNVQL